jgi:hypothetical protein
VTTKLEALGPRAKRACGIGLAQGGMRGRPNFVVFNNLSLSVQPRNCDRDQPAKRSLGRQERTWFQIRVSAKIKLPAPLGRVAAVVGAWRNADGCVAWSLPQDQQGGPFR